MKVMEGREREERRGQRERERERERERGREGERKGAKEERDTYMMITVYEVGE